MRIERNSAPTSSAGGGIIPLYNVEQPSQTFFGYSAGNLTMTGIGNTFIGAYSGMANTSGYSNAFFGNVAGTANTTGYQNAVFGSGAGSFTNTGNANAFFGNASGYSNTGGSANSFYGNFAGYANVTGEANAFFGHIAGTSNTVENNNSFIGAYSDGAAGITNSAAIGYRAKVTQSNSLVLGSINGVNGSTLDTKVGIGITAPAVRLDVVGGMRVYPANENESGLVLSNQIAPSVWQFATYNSGKFYIQEAMVGPRIVVTPTTGNVGIGTADPTARLHVVGNVYATGGFSVPSDARLKQAIKPLDYGLREVLRLRPVSFEWKDRNDGKLNLGLIAQEVESVVPEIVEKSMGEAGMMGMNYPALIPVLIKAVQEQQSLVQEQKSALERKDEEVAALNARLSALEQLVERLTRDERLRQK